MADSVSDSSLNGRNLSKACRLIANSISHLALGKFDRPPIVIGGCGRSGTTLLLSVLSAHPHIFAIAKETSLLCPTAYDDTPNPVAPLRIRRLYRHLLSQHIPKSCRRWSEKTPKNVMFFGPILAHFGDRVRLIHIVRDGRDVITSTHPVDEERFWVTPERWIQDVKAGLTYQDHDQVLTVRYEDLVLRFETEIQRIGRFLDEDFASVQRHWHENATVRNARGWFHQVMDVHSNSVGRWRDSKYERLVADFMKNPEAVSLLERLQFTSNS